MARVPVAAAVTVALVVAALALTARATKAHRHPDRATNRRRQGSSHSRQADHDVAPSRVAWKRSRQTKRGFVEVFVPVCSKAAGQGLPNL